MNASCSRTNFSALTMWEESPYISLYKSCISIKISFKKTVKYTNTQMKVYLIHDVSTDIKF